MIKAIRNVTCGCLLFVVLFFLSACSSDASKERVAIKLTSAAEVSLGAIGGEFEVCYTLGGETDYKNVNCSSSEDWILVVRQELGVLTLAAEANTTGNDRMAAVMLSYADSRVSVVVQQSGKPDATVITIVSDTEYQLGRAGQPLTIVYTVENKLSEDQLYATANVDWIYGFSMKNEGELQLGIASNLTGSDRCGKVTIGCSDATATLMVYQAGDGAFVFEAQRLHGYYYGDQYSPGTGNYWFVLSDRGFDVDGRSYPVATYYRIDAYAPMPEQSASQYRIPVGRYSFDASNSLEPWTFSANYSGFWQTDAQGGRAQILPIEAGELLVEEGKMTLTLTIQGEEHTVTYAGTCLLEDLSAPGYVYSTLEDDYQADLSDHHMICKCYGDYYDYGYMNWMFVIQPNNGQGDCFQFDIITDKKQASDGFCGIYTSSDYLAVNSFIPGWTDGVQMLCSWFFTVDQSELAPFRGGEMSVTDNGDGTVTVEIEVFDDAHNKITGTWTGVPEQVI